MPQVMYINTTQKVCVSFMNSTTYKTVYLYLENSDKHKFQKHFFKDESGCLDLQIPESLTVSNTAVTVEIHSEGSEVITEKADVKLSNNSLFTLIQTDKPIYKPGQTVKFRILTINSALLPVLDLKTNAWIEDPNKIKVAQWRDVNCPEGLCSEEMLLSEEPVLGKWTIFTKIGTVFEQQQTFQVEEYVLPTFEVTIKPPSFLMADTEHINVEVCAKYIYGKHVKGNFRVNMTVKSTYRSVNSVEETGKIDGCKIIKTKGSYFDLDTQLFGTYHFLVFAEVRESGTGVKINATHPGIEIHKTALKLNIEDYSKSYLKPGLPYFGKVFVTKPDDSPAADEKIKITVDVKQHLKYSKTLKSDSNGFVTFTIPAINEDVGRHCTINAKAIEYTDKMYPNMPPAVYNRWIQQPEVSYYLKQWYSKSRSFIQIKPLPDDLICGKTYPVTVLYTTEDPNAKIEIYYQVMSRGSVILFNKTHHTFDIEKSGVRVDNTFLSSIPRDSDESEEEIPPFVDSFTIDLSITTTMSPKSYLLVYFYVIQNKTSEIVADSHSFKINSCLENKANLNFLQPKILPGDKAQLELKAPPKSLCAIGVVDKSVHILKKGNQITKERVFKHLNQFEPQDYFRRTKCYSDPWMDYMSDSSSFEMASRLMFPGHDSQYIDSLEAFRRMGIITLSNIVLETRPCYRYMFMFSERPGPPGLPGFPGTPGLYGHSGKADPLFPESGRVHISAPISPDYASIREQDSIAKLKPQKSESLLDLRNYFPETWLWELQIMNHSGSMILEKEVPHTITTWIGNMFCIHSSAGLGISPSTSLNAFQPFFVSLNLPYSIIRGETVPLAVSIFNYLPESISIKLSLEKSNDFILSNKDGKKLCVKGGESKVHKFIIQPLTLGYINVTVHAKSITVGGVCGNDVTRTDEVKDSITQKVLIEAEGFPEEHTQSNLVCPKDSPDGTFTQAVQISLPENVVNGSARAKINVIGDIMGPVLSGLDKLVQLPMGCGEQNMALLAPLVFVMKYLKNTNQALPELSKKADSFMQSGYQRQSNYLHDDGSYSAFGKSDSSGSLWLTSFVVKTFVQAKTMVEIDPSNIAMSKNFLIKQQKENGCFENVGRLLQKSLMGGIAKSEDGEIVLSAYVMISLLGTHLSSSSETIQKALLCITRKEINDIYGMSLITYALTLAGEYEKATTLLQKLENLAIKTAHTMYWESKDSNNKGISVEIAAYNLLIYSHMLSANKEYVVKALKIVQWLSQQRNSYGGFHSTQDTVVALEALAAYASKTYDENININISIKESSSTHDFHLNADNRLILQTRSITNIPNLLEVTATGIGCALIQVITLYNIPDSRVKEVEPFTLNATVNHVTSGPGACKKWSMHICTRYGFPDAASNMAIIEVKMVTGFWPDKNSLKLLIAQNPEVKRFEIDNKMINFYFDEITSEEICINFIIEQHIDIKDAKPGTVRVYDYYNQGISKSAVYTVDHHQSDCLPPKSSSKQNLNTNKPKNIPSFKSTVMPNLSDILRRNDNYNGLPEPSIISSSPNNLEVDKDDSIKDMVVDDPDTVLPTLRFPDLDYTVLPTLTLIADQSLNHIEDKELKCFDQNKEDDNSSCPICSPEDSDHFKKLFCSSNFVAIRTTSFETSSTISLIKPVKYTVTVNARMAPTCKCDQLKIGLDKMISILGNPNNFEPQNFVDGCNLNLNKNFHIIPISSDAPLSAACT